MPPRIDPDARCDSTSIGSGTSIGPMSIVDREAIVGSNCHIADHVSIQGRASIGSRVTVESGARIGLWVTIEDDVSIGPNAAIGYLGPGVSASEAPTILERDASVGAGSVVVGGVRLGLQSVTHPGSVVMSDVPPKAIVAGNPASIRGYIDTSRPDSLASVASETIEDPGIVPLDVGGCEMWDLPNYRDLRGSLVAMEFVDDLPFTPVRTFVVFSVPGGEVRGEHAHRECAQFLIAAHGALTVVVDDGTHSTEVSLDSPTRGLYIPPGVWAVQYKFQEGGVLVVHASHSYDSDEYIRDYSEFRQYVVDSSST